MGGKGPSAPAPQPVPAAPAPIDYDKMAAASIRVANAQIAAEEESIKRLYPQYINMQFGTADQLAGRLNNEYLQRARGVVGEELQAASAPNAIEAQLQRDAESELALGRSLTPEQQREASQSARAAFAARGLGASMGSSAAEILNRDAYGTARQDARRGFAANVNQMDLARRQRRIGLSGMYMETDPYRQALGPAFGLGGDTLRTSQGQVSNIFGNSLGQAGNVFSFNTNMAASNRNAILNNNASLQAASMQAGAMNNAATMGMIGSIGGGLLGGAGFALSDKREKKDIKPLGKAGSVLGLTAYEFSYKGDDKKHKGFMAQDVAKVLPDAVAEVDYKGKKRLAIKPAVIGAALAEELMAAKAA
jgi:hypothetical protein